jgi:hypothetical protein
MNAKIVIPISVIITIVIVVFSLTQIETVEKEAPSQIETVEKEAPSQIEETDKIDSMLQKIEEDRIKNENSKDVWYPSDREWIQSGPFKMDRSEYLLGEKIFINVDYLPKNVKGEMIFTKIINSTHTYEYQKIKFDGSKPQQNFYLGLSLHKFMELCTADMLVGDWELRFVGPNNEFNKLDFKVINKIIPGLEEQYEPVC